MKTTIHLQQINTFTCVTSVPGHSFLTLENVKKIHQLSISCVFVWIHDRACSKIMQLLSHSCYKKLDFTTRMHISFLANR